MSQSDGVLEALFSVAKPGDMGLIGDPVDHSLSPLMQNAAFKIWWGAFRDKKIPTPTYHKIRVSPEQLPFAIALAEKYKFRGLNITVPHKVAACQIVDDMDAFAKKVGAVNTVKFSGGKSKGFNTDGDGFRLALERDSNFQPSGKKALVLGAGGTGVVLVHELVDLGAKVFWWNRSQPKLIDVLRESPTLRPAVTHVTDPSDLAGAMDEADLVVNATSVGLSPDDGMPAPDLKFRSGQVAYDVIYHRETRFLQEARAAGAKAEGGLGMLVYQGSRSFEIWIGAPAPKEVMWSALTKSMKQG